MDTVHLITGCQVTAARHAAALVVEFVELHTSDDISDPDYATARARALEVLARLDVAWQHLPTLRTIGRG